MATPQRYSIAEARNHLPRLIHEAEKGLPVELTRWGKPVAILLSVHEYERAVQGKRSFWEALSVYRSHAELDHLDVDEAFEGVRDTGPGRQTPW